MSKIFETVIDRVIGVITFFDEMKTRRGDDGLTRRRKELQSRCVWATSGVAGVFCVALMVGFVLDEFRGALHNPAPLEEVRSTAGDILLGIYGLAFAHCVYRYWKLLRFLSDQEFSARLLKEVES